MDIGPGSDAREVMENLANNGPEVLIRETIKNNESVTVVIPDNNFPTLPLAVTALDFFLLLFLLVGLLRML